VTRRLAVRSRFPVVVIATTAIASGLCLAPLLAQQRQVPGAFRGRVVLVPVDIRVLDRDGNPVTNLTQDDFTIFENDVPQRIGHFSTQAFTAAPPGVNVTPVLRRNPGLETTPVTYRTFLIVLGRGRLKEPANGMDAIIEMVRSRLLPQDQIGVLAYNRAYGLTTDRGGVLRLLESFRCNSASAAAKFRRASRPGSTRCSRRRGSLACANWRSAATARTSSTSSGGRWWAG